MSIPYRLLLHFIVTSCGSDDDDTSRSLIIRKPTRASIKYQHVYKNRNTLLNGKVSKLSMYISYTVYETREDTTFLVVFRLNSLCFSFGYDQIEINYFKPINESVSIQLHDPRAKDIDFVFLRILVG